MVKIKKIFGIAVIALAFCAFLSLAVSADDGIDPEMYCCREALSKADNGEALVYAYDQIAAGVEKSLASINVYDGENPISIKEMETVVDAYRRDYVHHFWIGSSYRTSFNSETITKISMEYIMSGDELSAAKAAFELAVAEILKGITPDMTDFEKELYFHDTLASRIVYVNTNNAHNAYGALCEGYAVCEGYAEALQYLLHRVGIRSFIAIGSGNDQPHAWNCVEIDGKFYHTDLTWNDQGEIFHAYFNVSDAVIKKDHYIEPTSYQLPVCDSDSAMYFKVMGGYLESYNTDLVAAMFRNNIQNGSLSTISVYVPEDSGAFLNWLFNTDAFGIIAGKAGAVGSIGANASSIGSEYKITMQSDFSGTPGIPAYITGASLSFGSDLTMNFYVENGAYSELDPESFTLKVTMCGETVIIDEYITEEGKFVFAFDGIAPQLMSELIDVEVYSAGVKIYDLKGYSVKENAQGLLTLYKTDEALVKLVSDILRYGDAAQIYRDYKTDCLATQGVTGMTADNGYSLDSTDKNVVTEDAVDDVYFTYAGVWFDNVNKIYVKLSSYEGAKIVVKSGGKVVAEYEDLNSETVYTGAISASHFNTVYDFELYDNGVLVQTLTYSISSYCYSMKSSENANMKALAKALYDYGISAEEYIKSKATGGWQGEGDPV